jgi:glutamine amidotransferase
MSLIALVDYGAGNLTSVIKGLSAAGASVRVCARPSDLPDQGGVVIPGVGHFAATGTLDADWRQAILDRVRANGPLLGICLGLQWLFEGSQEAPDLAGLGIFEGRCFRLPDTVKVPHVGWNTLDRGDESSCLLAGVPAGSMAYFTHSFAAPVVDQAVALTTHGVPFAAVVERGCVYGTQFHPEKSGTVGQRVLANFVALNARAGR